MGVKQWSDSTSVRHILIATVNPQNGQQVRYTVGQQSVTGTSSNGYVVQQGFQQSNWGKILEQNTISITTMVYPNPFVNEINFSFSISPGEKISAFVFDVLGRLVYSEDVKNENNSIKIALRSSKCNNDGCDGVEYKEGTPDCFQIWK